MPKLILVPGPIGNLEDITLRAIRVLKEADAILAEDTRTAGNLLRHLGINTRLMPYHSFNEHKSLQKIINELMQGHTFAMLSDAGTPGISDPGFLLVRECIQHNIEVECLPGPTAFVPALINSGLPCDKFWFEGFLPHKKGRQTRFKFLATLPVTMVLYESPHRLVKTLEQLSEIMGPDRKACVSRELTKVFEENIRGSLSELILFYSTKAVKGEIVITVEGHNKKNQSDEE
ncbi:MAG: 16S rRNA (cytidine(1402)-2'-O)-methyltransferase [Bacteroidales bacterium]|jgi:16S rRNA (cytidine1402-2'-O)-methyltransferase|nr:16S rRNA (cytidine(1402)-2'-O)-methyltransferase [Bacteroidales bacterium]